MSSPLTTTPEIAPLQESSLAEEPLVRTLIGASIFIFGIVATVLLWMKPTGGIDSILVTLALQLLPGAGIGLFYRLRGIPLVLATVYGSAVTLVLIAMPMAWFGWWHVRPVALVLMLLASAIGGLVAVGELRKITRKAAPVIPRRIRIWALGSGGLSTLGFVLALSASKRGLPQPLGAIVSAGPICWIGLLLIIGAVAWSFGGGGGSPGWSVALLSCVVPSVEAMSYSLPTVQVAARHVGIVEFIVENGKVFPSTDIYHSWCGLFASVAFIKVAAGWENTLLYATIWGAIAAAGMVLAVRAVAGHFHADKSAWSAALIFGLATSLNPGFFAPQMFGFIGAFIVIALMLRDRDERFGRYGITTAVILVSLAIAVTHQLSPYLAFLGAAALTVTKMIRRWTLSLILIIPAVGFAYLNKGVLGPFITGHDLGQFLNNLRPPKHADGALQPALIYQITFYVPAACLAVIGVLAVFVLIKNRSRRMFALGVTAVSPVVLFFGSSYGSEGIFRVALFSLPWLSILVSYLLPEPGRRFWTPSVHPGRIVAVLSLTLVHVIGCTGMDYSRVIRAADVTMVTWLENTVPNDAYVYSLGTKLAEPLYVTGRRTGSISYISREMLVVPPAPAYPLTTGAAYNTKEDLARFTAIWKYVAKDRPIYVYATDQMSTFDELYGQQRASDQNKLEEELRSTTSNWRIVYFQPEARVYQYIGPTS